MSCFRLHATATPRIPLPPQAPAARPRDVRVSTTCFLMRISRKPLVPGLSRGLKERGKDTGRIAASQNRSGAGPIR